MSLDSLVLSWLKTLCTCPIRKGGASVSVRMILVSACLNIKGADVWRKVHHAGMHGRLEAKVSWLKSDVIERLGETKDLPEIHELEDI